MFVPDEQNEILSALERVSKLVGFSAAFIYLAGFIVVSRYVSRNGVYSLSIFQLQYLVAGTWAVVPLVGMTLALRTSRQFGGTAWEKWGRFTWRRLAVISVVTTLPFGLAFGAVAGFFGDVEGLKWAALTRLAHSTSFTDLSCPSACGPVARETLGWSEEGVPFAGSEHRIADLVPRLLNGPYI